MLFPSSAVDAAPGQAAAAQTETFDETTAGAAAKAQGSRVEVSRLRTQTDRVFKNSNGTTTREQHLEPVQAAMTAATTAATTGPAISSWARVDKSTPTTSYFNFPDADPGVGSQTSGADAKRLFFAFPTTEYVGKNVLAATFSAYEVKPGWEPSGNCAVGRVDAYLTGDFSPGITWSSQPPHASAILSSYGPPARRSVCPTGAARAEFDVTSGVRLRVAQKRAVTTIALMGRSEDVSPTWRRFAGPQNPTIAYRPLLSVTYNSTANAPATAGMFAPDTNSGCATTAATSTSFNQNSTTASLIASGG